MLIHAKNTVFWLFDPISRPQDPARDNFEPLGWHIEGAHLDGTGLPQPPGILLPEVTYKTLPIGYTACAAKE